MIIELHLLQSFPVSNLNRDDVGQPKTATFGGRTRGRISSQCLKRSARLLFHDYGLDTTETGVRTKRLLTSTTELLTGAGREPEQAAAVAAKALETLGYPADARGLTQYLLFVGKDAIDHLADYCTRRWDELALAAAVAPSSKAAKVKPDKAAQAEAKRILDASRVADVALFGRMIADNKDLSVAGASQVAHALSTHAATTEFDYFTAVDDLKPDAESGADMIGTVDFNAACYYRYANLDTTQLAENLTGDADLVARTTRAWLYAFINAVPSGKQQSMAARTMPETLLGVVRGRGAWNLANAFLKPITSPDIMAGSTDALLGHFRQLRAFYGDSDLAAVTVASVTGNVDATSEGDHLADDVDEFVQALLTGAEV